MKPHTPPAHDGVPFAGALHALPHAEQLRVSDARSTHAPLQFVVKGGHDTTHVPPEQTWSWPHVV